MASTAVLQTEIIARLGNRTDIGARVLTWLNDSYFELLMKPTFSFFELDASATITTVADTRTYDLSSITDLWFILDLRDETNSRRIRKANIREFDETQHTSGQPTRYARFNDAIDLDPTPDDAYTLTLRYRKRLTELTTGTSPLIGREWDEVLIALAVLKGREALGQTDEAAAQRSLVGALLDQREAALQLEDMDSDTTIGVEMQGW